MGARASTCLTSALLLGQALRPSADPRAVVERGFRQRRRPSLGARHRSPDLRAGFRGMALVETVDHLLEQLRRQVLVGILEDLDHRRVGAGAEALDLLPREVAIGRKLVLVLGDAMLADLLQ